MNKTVARSNWSLFEQPMLIRAGLLSSVFLYLYLTIFLLPCTPALLSGDQLFFWMNGQRILYGELPYRDFFQFTPPGTDLVYFATFQAFGPRIWVVDTVVLILGVALCWVCFETAHKIMRPALAVLATLLFVTLIYSRLLNATHHWFSVLAIMIAVFMLMGGIHKPRLAGAGAMLGIACFFTQTHPVAALLAILVFLKYRAREQSGESFGNNATMLVVPFLLVVVCTNAYFIIRAGAWRLLYCQIYYVLRVMVHRPETPLLGMPELGSWDNKSLLSLAYEYGQLILVYTMLPLTYAVTIGRIWHKRGNSAPLQPTVFLLAMTGCGLLVELTFSLNWLRLYAVSMPGIVLFIYVIEHRQSRRYLTAAVAVVILLLAVQRVGSAQRHDYVVAELPAGKCAIHGAAYEKLSWLLQRTSPGDFVFEGNWPGAYIPLGLRNPVFLDTAATLLNPKWDEHAVDQLKAKDVRYVFWTARFDRVSGASSIHLAPLRSYLNQRYRKVHTFADGEQAWEKRAIQRDE